MKNKKAIIAVALTLGLSLSLVPSCESKKLDQTGAFVSDSQSLLSSEETFLSYLNNMEVVDTISVLTSPNEHPVIDCQKAAYDYLKANNISPEDIKDILENIIIFGNHPMGLEEEEYNNIIGILGENLPQNINAFTAFYPFALAYHESYCALKHDNNTCEDLDVLWRKMGPVDLEAILDFELKDDALYQRIKTYSIVYSTNMGSYIEELLTLGEVSLSSSISEESLKVCFPFLAGTLEPDENLMDTYYNLSKLVISIFERKEETVKEDNFSLKKA